MGRIAFFVFVLGLLGLAVGAVYLGAFPPQPHTQAVVKVLPNDRFQPKP